MFLAFRRYSFALVSYFNKHHHRCTTDAPQMHHRCTTDSPQMHHRCTTDAPQIHQFLSSLFFSQLNIYQGYLISLIDHLRLSYSMLFYRFTYHDVISDKNRSLMIGSTSQLHFIREVTI